jgi:hypothetical protein
VKRILEEEPMPLKMVRRFDPYHEIEEPMERRMADWHFARAESWPELVAIHERWVQDYNEQSHWAHREREDGRRSPQEVLGWVTGVRYRKEDLDRAFFSTRFSHTLDSLGYARFRDWRVYGERKDLPIGRLSPTRRSFSDARDRFPVIVGARGSRGLYE